MVWALAKMEQHVESETLQQLLATAVRLAHKCTAQGLCNVVWAVATLKVMPERQWMQVRGSHLTAQALLVHLAFCTTRLAVHTVLHIFLGCACGAPAKPACATTNAYACTLAAALTLQEMLANIVPKLEDCGPQELSNLWWALGTLRWRLGPSLQEELAAELRVNVLELNAGETAMVLWALARCAPAARCQCIVPCCQSAMVL